MNALSRLSLRILALGIVALLMVAPLGHAQNANNIVYPLNSNPYGKSYTEWSQAWWQWAYGLPVDGHPLFDETGANASAGQSGPVWFLAGVFNVSGSAHRSITVPKGTALFFPIINVEWDNTCPPASLTIQELKDLAASITDLATDLACEVDGVAIPNLDQYRIQADAFSVTFPDNNIFQLFGCADVTAGTYYPFVGDGYYVMLKSLSKGHHTVHFTGTFGPPIGFTLDITYDIEVVDHHSATAMGAAQMSPISKGELARVANSIAATRPVPAPAGPGTGAIEAGMSPNPMSRDGSLHFTLSRPGQVDARLFDASGRVVRVLANGTFLSAGSHELRVDRGSGGEPLSPGMYFYSLRTPEGLRSGRIAVLK